MSAKKEIRLISKEDGQEVVWADPSLVQRFLRAGDRKILGSITFNANTNSTSLKDIREQILEKYPDAKGVTNVMGEMVSAGAWKIGGPGEFVGNAFTYR